jgi:predicted neuraminidase
VSHGGSARLVAIALGALTTVAAAGQPRPAAIERAELLFERAPFASCHASTLVETPSGALLAAWFAGTEEGHADVGIWTARREREGWDAAVEVADCRDDGVDQPCWNPVLHQPSAGQLLLFYKAGPNPREWRGLLRRSPDEGRTWSPVERLPAGILGPIRAKAIELGDGTLLAGSSTEHDGWRLHFERTRDLGRTWETTGPIHDGRELAAIQPTFLTHDGGRLQALARSRQHRIVETWSQDGGRTWSAPGPTALPNPSAGIDALTLPDGRHLLVYNHTSSRGGERPAAGLRSELNLAVSVDGVAWRPALLLERQPGEYSYPAMIRTRDGRVHVTYTWRRQSIKHVVIDPEKLEPGEFVEGRWPE